MHEMIERLRAARPGLLYLSGGGVNVETESGMPTYQPRPRWHSKPFAKLNGFQTPPVDWRTNSPFKRAFFSRVAEVTGYLGEAGRT